MHLDQTLYVGVAGGSAGALEAIRACYEVTRPNHRIRANPMVHLKHHLRDARKRHGADARRAGQPAGVAPAKSKRQAWREPRALVAGAS